MKSQQTLLKLPPLSMTVQCYQGFSFVEILITLLIMTCMIQGLLQTQWFIQRRYNEQEQRLVLWLKQSNQYELTHHDPQ